LLSSYLIISTFSLAFYIKKHKETTEIKGFALFWKKLSLDVTLCKKDNEYN